MILDENVNDPVPFTVSERGAGMTEYYKSVAKYATDSAILNGIESLLKGLPDSVKHSLSAGELTETILNMIADLREKARSEEQ